LSDCLDYSCPVVLCGDFNIHVDDSSSLHGARFADLLQSVGYVQHVNTATHTARHTLDLVITRSDTDVTGVRVGDFISDHAVVHFTVQVKRPTDEPQLVTRREWRKFDKDKFMADLAASELCTDLQVLDNMSADDLAALYRTVMTQLLDKHCPVVTVRHKVRPATPWYDAECRDARRIARAVERRFRRRRSEADK